MFVGQLRCHIMAEVMGVDEFTGGRGIGGFGGILLAVVRWKNEFQVVLCQILNYWETFGSYRGLRSFK